MKGLLNRVYERLVFFVHFFKNPIELSTPMRTCKELHERVKEELNDHGVKRVVELGAGVGSVTENILEVLPDDGELLCIEQQEAFCDRLEERFHDSAKIVHGDALNVEEIIQDTKWEQPDAIVSTVPLIIDPADELCRNIRQTLPEGALYLQVANLPGPMEKSFEIEESWFFLTNLPPERLHRAVVKEEQ